MFFFFLQITFSRRTPTKLIGLKRLIIFYRLCKKKGVQQQNKLMMIASSFRWRPIIKRQLIDDWTCDEQVGCSRIYATLPSANHPSAREEYR